MTLLTVVYAAIVSTIIWYKKAPNNDMHISTLCFIYWGASIMWFVDAVYEYASVGAAYFSPTPSDMLNDLYLGLSAVALGLIIWLVILLVHDPKGVFKTIFKK